MNEKLGGPVHPVGEVDGMALWDYYAGQALVIAFHHLERGKHTWPIEAYAEVAAQIADSMLLERGKRCQ